MVGSMTGPAKRHDLSLTNDSPAERFFDDAEGTRWRVYESRLTDYDKHRGQSLIFSSETAVRRVRDFPENWANLSDEDLRLLSWKA